MATKQVFDADTMHAAHYKATRVKERCYVLSCSQSCCLLDIWIQVSFPLGMGWILKQHMHLICSFEADIYVQRKSRVQTHPCAYCWFVVGRCLGFPTHSIGILNALVCWNMVPRFEALQNLLGGIYKVDLELCLILSIQLWKLGPKHK